MDQEPEFDGFDSIESLLDLMHILATIQDPSLFINADFQGLFNDRENLSSISDACQL
jgi:hypothetical protein